MTTRFTEEKKKKSSIKLQLSKKKKRGGGLTYSSSEIVFKKDQLYTYKLKTVMRGDENTSD